MGLKISVFWSRILNYNLIRTKMEVLIWKNVFILFRSLLLTYLLRKMPWRYRFFRLTIKWRWDEKVRSWPPRSKSLWFIFLGQYDLYKFRFKTVYFPKLAHFRKSSLLNDKARSLIVINSPVNIILGIYWLLYLYFV